MKKLLGLTVALLFLAVPAVAHVPESRTAAHEVKIGAYIISLGKLDLSTGSYTVDMYLTFEGSAEDLDKMDFEFMNGRGGAEKIKITPTRREYRVQADLFEQVDFKRYPFDTQTLSIQIEDKKLRMSELKLVGNPKDSGIDPKLVLTGWKIAGTDLQSVEQKYPGDDDSFSRFVMKVRLARTGHSSVFKVFVPLLCFVLVTMITLLMRPASAEGRVATNTGMLIASVMFHVGVMSSLPSLGYLTLADHVFIATYAVIGFNVLQSVRMMRASLNDQKDFAMKIYSATLSLLPLVALIAYPLAILSNLML